jgi:hypothetical protein
VEVGEAKRVGGWQGTADCFWRVRARVCVAFLLLSNWEVVRGKKVLTRKKGTGKGGGKKLCVCACRQAQSPRRAKANARAAGQSAPANARQNARGRGWSWCCESTVKAGKKGGERGERQVGLGAAKTRVAPHLPGAKRGAGVFAQSPLHARTHDVCICIFESSASSVVKCSDPQKKVRASKGKHADWAVACEKRRRVTLPSPVSPGAPTHHIYRLKQTGCLQFCQQRVYFGVLELD